MQAAIVANLRTWAWALIPAAFAFALGYVGLLPLSAQTQSYEDRRADPATFRPGELNVDAVASAKSFTEFPLVWLGEEFRGFKLTAFIRQKSIVIPAGQLGQSRDVVQDSVGLIYGTCVPERSDDGEGPSCVAPLSIIINAPGTVPPPEGVAPEVAGPVGTTRGLTSRLVSGSTMLWAEGGITITVHSNTDVRADALGVLRLANAAQFGLDDIGSDESLAPLKGKR